MNLETETDSTPAPIESRKPPVWGIIMLLGSLLVPLYPLNAIAVLALNGIAKRETPIEDDRGRTLIKVGFVLSVIELAFIPFIILVAIVATAG